MVKRVSLVARCKVILRHEVGGVYGVDVPLSSTVQHIVSIDHLSLDGGMHRTFEGVKVGGNKVSASILLSEKVAYEFPPRA